MKETIKYKVMLADEGGMQIMEDGRRIIMADEDSLHRILGIDVASTIDKLSVSDVEVTITIEGE